MNRPALLTAVLVPMIISSTPFSFVPQWPHNILRCSKHGAQRISYGTYTARFEEQCTFAQDRAPQKIVLASQHRLSVRLAGSQDCVPSANATERLRQWHAPVAVSTNHTVVQDDVHLSRYCGDGTVFSTLGSRTQAKLAAHRGHLLVNGEEARAHTRVHSGDTLTLRIPSPLPMSPGQVLRVERLFLQLSEGKPEGAQLSVLYEDEELAVVMKPPGIHSTSWAGTQRREYGRSELSLEDILPLLISPPSPETGAAALAQPLPAHRLDARVGGVLAVAKTRRALASLSHLFASRAVRKSYTAVVVGEVNPAALAQGSSSGPARMALLEAEETGDQHLRIEEQLASGKVAVTELRVKSVTACGVYGALSTVDLRPLTGRRHQLRTACARCCGHPIVGDDLYHLEAAPVRGAAGLRRLPPVRRRAGLFLQAVELSLPHPTTGLPLTVAAPEMRRFERLRRRAAAGSQWSPAQWDAWREDVCSSSPED